jgi:GTP cyclohydrolase II
MDTVDANLALGHGVDERDWNDAIEIIENLGITHVTLLSNNPDKSDSLLAAGIDVRIIELGTQVHPENREYLLTKKNRMSHTLKVN